MAGIERIEIVNRKQWLKLREPDVTASRVGALFSAHPYATALRLYLEQRGVEFPKVKDSPVMRRGRLLEGAVALAVSEQRPDWQIIKNQFYYRDPELRLGATPDFLIEGDPRGLGVLQTKTVAPSVFERDWNEGREVPFWIMLQALTEAMLTEAAFAVVAPMRVDAFNLSCPIIELARHPGAEERIRQAVIQFWDDVHHGREPAPDYGRDQDLINVLAPRGIKDKTIDLAADNELPTLLEQREQLKDKIKAFETRCDEIETEVRFKMRDAERIVGLDDWSVTWKTQHRTEYTVPARDLRVLRIHDKRQTKESA